MKEKKPHKEVVKAWEVRNQLLEEATKIYPWINSAQIMNIASRVLNRTQYEKMALEADIIFFQAVIRCHGANTKVKIENGEFSLTFAD